MSRGNRQKNKLYMWQSNNESVYKELKYYKRGRDERCWEASLEEAMSELDCGK